MKIKKNPDRPFFRKFYLWTIKQFFFASLLIIRSDEITHILPN